ncbi:PLP-dependent aminotransferase family protein [Kiloniella majae]|uniref:aminotransferase-like domain-containing protein n=1 Tax=Kiloniella majae TaxID=1938558 RepID=UPI0015C4EF28|nr:PLP-dependent aminotransferase family protein [Kiloniella majae]
MTILSLISKNQTDDGQKYAHLEQLFKTAIRDGILKPGEKLPPLRAAAWEAKCSLGTMSRVYNSLERKGLVSAKVGRGTFVEEAANIGADVILPNPQHSRREHPLKNDYTVDLGMNAIANDWGEEIIRWALQRTSTKASSFNLMTYRDGFGDAQQKLALRAFLPEPLRGINDDRILINHGAQNGVYTALGRLSSPGDTICQEPLSYPGVSAAISQLGLSSLTVETDDQGICPISFEQHCKKGRVRILVTTATGHNPTCITTSLSRRKEIGAIARKYDVLIIEDDIYGFLYPDAPPPYAELFPEQAIYLSGLAKRITPSLRIGFAVAPPHLTMLMAQGITAQTWMVSPILINAAIEIASRTDDLTDFTRQTTATAKERHNLTSRILSPYIDSYASCQSHAWVRLPETISISQLVRQTSKAGVHILDGSRFANNTTAGRHNIRLSIMAPETIQELEKGLIKLSTILSNPNENSFDFF